MNNFVNKALCPDGRISDPDGPFDVCLDCGRRGNGCSGPRTTAMGHERYVAWLRRLFDLWDGTRQQLSDETGISKSTIDDIFAGRRKDISRATAGLLEDALIGGDAKWPCALMLDQDKEVVYEDRPETLEALARATEAIKEKDVQIANLRRNYEDIKKSIDTELVRIRDEHNEDIKFYRERIDWLVEQSRLKDAQLARKDDYIDRLAKQVGI